jgi:hypothetical protein
VAYERLKPNYLQIFGKSIVLDKSLSLFFYTAFVIAVFFSLNMWRITLNTHPDVNRSVRVICIFFVFLTKTMVAPPFS